MEQLLHGSIDIHKAVIMRLALLICQDVCQEKGLLHAVDQSR